MFFFLNQITGLPDSAQPKINIQLSSPIESQTITQLYDDINDNNIEQEVSTTVVKEDEKSEVNVNDDNDDVKEENTSSCAIFKGVDISVATITIDVSDLDIPLGSSAMYDVGPLCDIDVLGGVTSKVTQLEVAIIADGDSNNNVADLKVKEGEESKEEDVAVEEEEVDNTQTESNNDTTTDVDTPTKEEDTSSSIVIPTCILHLKIEYNASKKDQAELLTEKHNATMARYTVALEKLRKIAISIRRAQIAAAESSSSGDNQKPAVKPGFLQKKSMKKESMFLIRWYEKTIGPNSFLRKVYPIAKNYVLFFGGIVLMHYQGHQLALPPPV